MLSMSDFEAIKILNIDSCLAQPKPAGPFGPAGLAEPAGPAGAQ